MASPAWRRLRDGLARLLEELTTGWMASGNFLGENSASPGSKLAVVIPPGNRCP